MPTLMTPGFTQTPVAFRTPPGLRPAPRGRRLAPPGRALGNFTAMPFAYPPQAQSRTGLAGFESSVFMVPLSPDAAAGRSSCGCKGAGLSCAGNCGRAGSLSGLGVTMPALSTPVLGGLTAGMLAAAAGAGLLWWYYLGGRKKYIAGARRRETARHKARLAALRY